MRKLGLLGLAGLVVACGGRPDHWDAELSLPVQSVGLTGSVAVVDPELDRVMMLAVSSGRNLDVIPIGVGKNVVAAKSSADRSTLFVLSRGVQPRREPDDERPSLTVIEGGSEPRRLARYALTDPLQGLAIDPAGQWAVVYDAGGIVVNPNELILVKLDEEGAEPFPKTIRSFGGRPERLTFTSELAVPGGEPRRFLIVETGRDVTFIDLSDLNRDEVTVILPQTPTGKTAQPLEVDYHDGEPDDPSDARIAVRLANDSNVVLVELGPSDEGKPYKPTINVADVGGVPTDIEFVRTDGGLRLAALVPSTQAAALIDPATAAKETVELESAFSRISLVTNEVTTEPLQSDVALLWGSQTSSVAFWSLGKTSGTPFRSVDPYDLGFSVASVQSVPGDTFAHLKILESTSAAEFYVLDLDKRQNFPMLTNAPGFALSVSPDGGRGYALKPGTTELSSIQLSDLHPTSLEVERDVVAVYDIARRDGGRAAIMLHASDDEDHHAGLGATVLDALAPDTASSAYYAGLILGGLK
jgi:hypothetical protein